MPRFFSRNSLVHLFGQFFVLFLAFTFVFGGMTAPSWNLSSSVFAQGDDGEEAAEEEGEDPLAGAEEAAAAPGGTTTVEPVGESYLVWFISALGPIFAPAFAITSILFVMLAVMNFMAITRNNMMPQDMIEQFKTLLDEKKLEEAFELARTNESPQGKILAAGLARVSAGYEAAEQSMSDVAEEEITRYEQKLGYLALIGGIAPMLGLLGTVYGMVQSFQVIAMSGTAPQASELAKGISTALITTEVGLFIAIPATIIYELLRNKLALLVLELTVQTENIMSRFKGK